MDDKQILLIEVVKVVLSIIIGYGICEIKHLKKAREAKKSTS
jgi:hypothetical protein